LLTSFPSTSILDNFNRVNGSIGANWAGNTSNYAVSSNQLDVGSSEDIYWQSTYYGVDQEAFVTLSTIDSNATEIGLILKAQANNGWGQGMLDVVYNPAGHYVQVWTYYLGNWTQHGTNLPVTFVNSDQFGVRANSNGNVEVYRNGILLGTRNVNSWPFYAISGYIGLFNINASAAILDDFGGGTMSNSPTLTPTPYVCNDPITCNPVSSVPGYWRCNIAQCSGGAWIGTVINWPSWAAYENNARSGNNSRTVYSAPSGGNTLYPYMGSWADGCQITAVSGIVLIIEWQRGTDIWRETYLNPGQSHTIDLISPENGVLLESPNDPSMFSVLISNCTPQNIYGTSTPTAPVINTATATPTVTFTATNTSVPPTATFTATNTPSATATWTSTATFTSTSTPVPPTATFTYTPTFTPTPSFTPTFTLTNTATTVNTTTNTYTPVPPTATFTYTPTFTPTPSSTPTFTPIDTATAINTLTNTPLPTETNTPLPTITATYTPIPPTATLTQTSAATNSPTPTPIPAFTATPTATETATPANTPTATFILTSTTTYTPSPTSTNTPLPGPINTGLLNPSSNAAQTGGDNNGYEVNPTNAYANDNIFAVDNNSGTGTNTSCTNSGKDKHRFYNYGISLPGMAVIQGIEVRLDAKVDGTSGSPKLCVQLSWDGGVSWTTAKSTGTLGTAEQTFILGGPTDIWGHTWTVSQLGNANFHVRIIDVSSTTSRDFSLDWVAVRVTYR
jgi:hypothetical protein